MTLSIDLNADIGEGAPYDAELMKIVSSCNIACGGHAGDLNSMTAALALAKKNHVAAGAHPSFPDRMNFGRKTLDISGPDLFAALSEQVRNFQHIAQTVGVEISHLKPHGALYNEAAKTPELSDIIVRVLQDLHPEAKLVGPPNSELERAATAANLVFIREGFADRAYETDGSLRQRSLDGAVFHDTKTQVKQTLMLALSQTVQSYNRITISMPVETICIHGDTPGALEAARAIHSTLAEKGIKVCAV